MSVSLDVDNFTVALARSGELRGYIYAAWQMPATFSDGRHAAAAQLSTISLDHGSAAHTLLPTLPASAIALVRPQFETLVRAVWVAHAATEAELARLVAPLSLASQQAAKQLPGVPEMLSDLEKHGPRGASALLARARTRLGDGLNSFIHGGIHPFAREQSGYPVALLLDVLKNTNALSMLTLIVLATLTEDENTVAALSSLHGAFADVLPELEPLPTTPRP